MARMFRGSLLRSGYRRHRGRPPLCIGPATPRGHEVGGTGKFSGRKTESRDMARVEAGFNDLDCRMRKLEMKGYDLGENKHLGEVLKRTDKLEDKGKENGAK